MTRYPVPRRGWVWLIIFAVLVVLALVRLAVFFGAESPLVPTPTPRAPATSKATVAVEATDTLAPTAGSTQTPPATTTRSTETATQPTSPVTTATRTMIPTPPPSPTATALAGLFIPTPPASERMPTIGYGSLPAEAQEVIQLIDQGGPFPYRQDGATFQNRERLLPAKASGYYREYTVETPGSGDRGARRIVAGREGELYYTMDHYASFTRVVP